MPYTKHRLHKLKSVHINHEIYNYECDIMNNHYTISFHPRQIILVPFILTLVKVRPFRWFSPMLTHLNFSHYEKIRNVKKNLHYSKSFKRLSPKVAFYAMKGESIKWGNYKEFVRGKWSMKFQIKVLSQICLAE